MVLDAALFWRTTTVVWHWSNITDNSQIEPYCLQRANRGFSSGPWPFYQNFHFLQPMTHCLPGRVLGNHLRCISSAFARTLEADFASARPSDHVAFHVGDRHDCVVERRKHMRDARMNVLAAFRFDDLWLLDVIA